MNRLNLPAICLSVLEGGCNHRPSFILLVNSVTRFTPLASSGSAFVMWGESSEKKSVSDFPVS